MANRKDNPEDVKTEVISMKVTSALLERINKCAKAIKVSRAGLAEQAIEAAVDAIEANNYRIVVPIEFDVRQMPVALRPPEQGKALA